MQVLETSRITHPKRYELDRLAGLHIQAIDTGFLSTFGRPFLRTLYLHFCTHPAAFVIVARKDDQILGLICGSTNTSVLMRSFILRWGWRHAHTIVWKVIMQGRLKRIVETLRYPSSQESGGQDVLTDPEAEILNLCVEEQVRGCGIGKALFQALTTEFRDRGVSRIKIVSGENQGAAHHLYEKSGAVFQRRLEVHVGTISRLYYFNIPQKDNR